MFARVKKSGKYQYLQIVENKKVDRKSKQRVIATVGRLDELQDKGRIENLIVRCSKGRGCLPRANRSSGESKGEFPSGPATVRNSPRFRLVTIFINGKARLCGSQCLSVGVFKCRSVGVFWLLHFCTSTLLH